MRAIVVTGAGKYFSAGPTWAPGVAVRAEPARMRTPVIAAMNGSAVGMGIPLPAGWDLSKVKDYPPMF